LSDAELLALLLRTGIKGKGVLQVADGLLHLKKDITSGNTDGGFDGISCILHASAGALKRIKGRGLPSARRLWPCWNGPVAPPPHPLACFCLA